MTKGDITDAVLAAYLATDDFNGLPASRLADRASGLSELKALLRPLIEDATLIVVFGDMHPNPHIRAFEDPEIEVQLANLDAATDADFVVYPTAATLEGRVRKEAYATRPFTLKLALGAPQLAFVAFDLAVIDHYRRDPRYHLWTNDIQATLSIGDEAFVDPTFPEKHKVLIQTFGFCHTPEGRRAVAVFLSDLSGLSPEHQQVWAAYEVQGAYSLHPDFERAALRGDWDLKASLREAFTEELRVVNAMCQAMGRPPLFRSTFDDPPRELAFLVRPTVAEFNEFVLVLDKLLSDNIDHSSFPETIPRETLNERPDGKVVARARGSLAMLEDWMRVALPPAALGPLAGMMTTLRKIRKLRQTPAHSVSADAHDEALFARQRELFKEAYQALNALRSMLQTDPRTLSVTEGMDERVRDGPVWEF